MSFLNYSKFEQLRAASLDFSCLSHRFLTDPRFVRAVDGSIRLRRGFRQQAVVVCALILREVRTRFGEHRLGYLWALLEPCMFIALWLGVFAVFRVGSMIHDMGPTLFMAAGIIPFFAFRHVASYVEVGISANGALLQFPQVGSVDALLARFILESSTQILIGAVIFSALVLTEQAKPPRDILGIYIASGSLLLLGFGFGAFNCMVTVLLPVYARFSMITQRLLFWTSGIFFLVDKFPTPAQKILAWNPVLHGIELFRTAWSHTYRTAIGSVWYILACAGVFLLLGLLLERSARRELQDQ